MSIKKRNKLIWSLAIFLLMFIGGISTIVYSISGTKVTIKFGDTEVKRSIKENQWVSELSDTDVTKNNESVDKDWFINTKNSLQFVVDLGEQPKNLTSTAQPFTLSSKLNDADISDIVTDIKPDKPGTYLVKVTLPATVTSGKLKFSLDFAEGNSWNIPKAVKTFAVKIDNNAPKLEYKKADGSEVKNNTIYEPFEMTIKLNEENKKLSNIVTTITKTVNKITNNNLEVKRYEWNNPEDKDSITYNFDNEGDYTIKTTGTDKAGNAVESSTSGGETIEIAVSKNLPQVKMIGIENGEEIKTGDATQYSKSSRYKISIENYYGINILSSNYTITDKNKVKVDSGNFFLWSSISGGKLQKEVKTLNEGEYTVVVDISKLDGTKISSSFALSVDGKAPSSIFTYGGKNYNASDTIYSNQRNTSGSLQINDVNLKSYKVTVKKDDTPIIIAKMDESGEVIEDQTENSGYAKLEFESQDATSKKLKFSPLKDNKYTIKVEAEDKAGNKYSPNANSSEDKQVVTFVMDGEKPSVKFDKDMKAFYNLKSEDETPKPVIHISDDNFGTSIITVKRGDKVIASVNENGDLAKDNVETISVKKDSDTRSFSFDGIKQDGVYKIDIVSVDKAGNEFNTAKDEKNKQINFTLDQAAPVINIKMLESNGNLSDLEDGKTYHYNENKLLNFAINDVNHDKDIVEIINENGTSVLVNPFQGNGVERKTSYNFTEEGTYKVKVESTDSAGNNTTRNVTIIIDKTAPVIEIEDFNDLNNSFSNPEKTVTVKVTEKYYENDVVNVKYEKITPDGKVETFNPKFGTEENGKVTRQTYSEFEDDAEYRMTITAKDEAGNLAATKSVVFTTDKTKPSVSITGVDSDNYYNVSKAVNLTSTDVNQRDNSVVVTRNGQTYNIGNIAVNGRVGSLNYTFSEEGNYEINFLSTDKAGNSNDTSTRFTIDKTAPNITPMLSNDGSVIHDGEYINKTFTPVFRLDNSEDTIESVTLNNGGNIAGNVPVASEDAKYSYKVVAKDKAKNETALNVSFTVDTTNPRITISGIMAGFFNKDMTPKYEIFDTNLDQAKTSALMNGAVFASGTKLDKQVDYNFKLLATDLASNKSDDSISFAIDKDKPVIKFETPMSGKYFTEDFIPKFVIEDLSDYTIISMTLDGENYQAGEEVTEEGKHVLFIEVKDKAGNTESVSVEFILDKTPPKFIVEGIENGKTYYEAASSSIKLDNPQDKINSVTVNGQLVEKHEVDGLGQDVYKLNFSEVKGYEVVLKATDLAGNKTEQKINIKVANKTILTTIYTNKPLLYSSIAGVIIAIVGLGFFMFRGRGPKKGFKTEYTN